SSALVVPDMADAKRELERRFTDSSLPSCATWTSGFRSSESAPFLPLSVTVVPLWLNSMPSGSTTGFFATLDIFDSRKSAALQAASGNDAKDLAAYTLFAGLPVAHDACRCRNDRNTQAAQYLRQL